MATAITYKSYSFKDKDPVIDEVRTIIEREKASYQEISEKSGVSAHTPYSWLEGATRRPQHATLMAVVRCLGYDYKLVKASRR